MVPQPVSIIFLCVLLLRVSYRTFDDDGLIALGFTLGYLTPGHIEPISIDDLLPSNGNCIRRPRLVSNKNPSGLDLDYFARAMLRVKNNY